MVSAIPFSYRVRFGVKKELSPVVNTFRSHLFKIDFVHIFYKGTPVFGNVGDT